MLELSERVRCSDQPMEQKQWVALQRTLCQFGVHNLTDTDYGGFQDPVGEVILSLAPAIAEKNSDVKLDMEDERCRLLEEMVRHFLSLLSEVQPYDLAAEHLQIESELNSRGYWLRDDYPLRVGLELYAMTEDKPCTEVAFSLHRVNPFKRFHVYGGPKSWAVKQAYDDVMDGMFDAEYADADVTNEMFNAADTENP